MRRAPRAPIEPHSRNTAGRALGTLNSALIVILLVLLGSWLSPAGRQQEEDAPRIRPVAPAPPHVALPAPLHPPSPDEGPSRMSPQRNAEINVLYGPAMRDPRYTALLADSLNLVIDDEFRVFFRAVSLAPDDYRELRKYLVDRRIALFEAETMARATSTETQNAELAATAQIDGEIRQRFGNQLADQLSAYSALPRGSRQQLADIVGAIDATEEPLSKSQIAAVLAAYISNAANGHSTLAEIRGGLTIPDSVVEQSKESLSPAQLEVLQTLRGDQGVAQGKSAAHFNAP